MLRSPIVTMVLSILFTIAAALTIAAYRDLDGNREKLETLKIRLRVMTHQKKDVEKTQVQLDRLDGFMRKAATLGLEQENWASYDVNIQEPVTFAQMARILNQCVNTPDYYFKPVSLQVKTQVKPDQTDLKGASLPAADDSFDPEKGDVLLTLKGAFVVMHR